MERKDGTYYHLSKFPPKNETDLLESAVKQSVKPAAKRPRDFFVPGGSTVAHLVPQRSQYFKRAQQRRTIKRIVILLVRIVLLVSTLAQGIYALVALSRLMGR
jgi:hypothetical protein